MKHTLLILATFALAITALHAQVLPGTVPAALAPAAIDPTVQEAVEAAMPAKYASYTSLGLILLMMLGRWVKAVQNGTGIKGWFSAIWSGTNTPHLLIACLCLLSLPSCAFLKSPQGRQMIVSLEQLGATAAVASGKLTPGDALAINEGTAVLTSGDTAMSKIVSLGSIGLDAAASKNLIAPGDVVLIKDAGAIITKAITPPPATGVPGELTSAK